ncbi:hypothetical protein BV20DRAFT_1056352 [Pilatotrama ljubarskyi]|nr:hypothetical protein BV20DRAFT_1056352 [Pilatotrama ljubarskyi]
MASTHGSRKSFIVLLIPPAAASAGDRHLADLYKRGSVSEDDLASLHASESAEAVQDEVGPWQYNVQPAGSRDHAGLPDAGGGRAGQSFIGGEMRQPRLGVAHSPVTTNEYPGVHTGTYVYGEQERVHAWRNQHYTVQVRVNQTIPAVTSGPHTTHSDVVKMLVDTGSSATWIAATNHRAIIKQARFAPFPPLRTGTHPSIAEVRIDPFGHIVTAWPVGDAPDQDLRQPPWNRRGRGMVNLGYHVTITQAAGISIETMDLRRSIAGDIRYENDAAALLTLQPAPDNVRFMHLYDWGARSWQNGNLWFRYNFGIAYAVSARMVTNNFLGILGLSPADTCKDAFRDQPVTVAPSFLYALITQDVMASVVSASDKEGLVIFFGIRQPSFAQSGAPLEESWMAYNRSRTLDWCIRVKSVSLQQYSVPLGKYVVVATYDVPFLALLDSGTSVSYVPRELIESILVPLIGPNAASSTRSVHFAPRKASFKVPPHVNSRHFRLELVIEGRGISGPQDASVPVPVDPFVYTRRPGRGPDWYTDSGYEREGLLWSNRTGAPFHVFGLNFFQAMFVALHKPDPRVPRQIPPYIRLAPQWPHERASFTLPP